MKPFAEFCAHYELEPKDEPALELRRIRILSANGSPMWVDARIFQSLGLKLNEPSPFLTAEEVTAAYLAKGGADE